MIFLFWDLPHRPCCVIAWAVLLLVLGLASGHEYDQHERHLQDKFVRCGTETPSKVKSEALNEQVSKWLALNPEARNSQETITVCTYVHVIEYSDGTGGVADDTIDKQMRVLNEGFEGAGTTDFCGEDSQGRPSQGGVTTPFQFQLAGITRTKNDRWANWSRFQEMEPKMALRRGDEATLNMYIAPQVTSFSRPLLGYATFPNEYNADPILDGVVLVAGSLPGGNKLKYNQGDTATHEVGHWLGLFHTFHNGCDGGDFVDDTPAQGDKSSGCPTSADTCPGEGKDPVTNFMDYSDDCCLNEFTAGQSERMLAEWRMFRASGNACRPDEPTISPPPSIPPVTDPPTGDPPVPVPPDNDSCALASTVLVPSSTQGSTAYATIDVVDSDSACGLPVTSPGVWYTFTASVCGQVKADTCESSYFDTVINIYGGSCEELLCVTANDDGCEEDRLQSSATFGVEAGFDYFILVHGFLFSTGSFDLTLTLMETWDCDSPPTDPPSPVLPSNDLCPAATEISPPSSTLGSTRYATSDGDDIGPFCGMDIMAPGVWFTFRATECGLIQVDTCAGASYDTRINVYSGSSCEELNCLAADDDGCASTVLSLATFDVEAGLDYYILVQGYAGGTGSFNLTLALTESRDCADLPPTPEPSLEPPTTRPTPIALVPPSTTQVPSGLPAPSGNIIIRPPIGGGGGPPTSILKRPPIGGPSPVGGSPPAPFQQGPRPPNTTPNILKRPPI